MLYGKHVMTKHDAAVELGRSGGKARAAKLTPDERKGIASKAARARWGTSVPSDGDLAGLGDYPAMAYVRVGGYPTGAMADTGTKRTVIDRVLAERANAIPLHRTGRLNIAGTQLQGELMRVRIEAIDGPCAGTVDAFVPLPGQVFRKGILLGMDFFQASGMNIDGASGEAFCPTRLKKTKSARRRKH